MWKHFEVDQSSIAKHEAAYLVDMARVEALDTMGEKEKAVAILDRHV